MMYFPNKSPYEYYVFQNQNFFLSKFFQFLGQIDKIKQQIFDHTVNKQNIISFINSKSQKQLSLTFSIFFQMAREDYDSKILNCIKNVQELQKKLYYLQTGKHLQGLKDMSLYLDKQSYNFAQRNYQKIYQKLKNTQLPDKLKQKNSELFQILLYDYKKIEIIFSYIKQRKYLDQTRDQPAYPQYIKNCACNVYHTKQYEKQRLIENLEQQKRDLNRIFYPVLQMFRLMKLEQQQRIEANILK